MTDRTADDRERAIEGLRRMADFLAAHPDVPIDVMHYVQYSVDNAVTAGRRAEVERVAALLDVTPTGTPAGHYIACRQFGPVQYVAVSCHPSEEAQS